MHHQGIVPLFTALRDAAQRIYAAFHTPGHKRGQGISPLLAEAWGTEVFRADLPELPGLDNLFAPDGVIEQAQVLAAEAFGADQTWFLVNGSTCGIEAALLATCNPGDQVILPRNVHQSAINGLILSGAMPVFVSPDYDSQWDIAHCPTPEVIAAALEQYPAKAVLVVSPTYYGTAGNLRAISQLTHQRGLPLLVDEAHGAHFAFHPELPTPALAVGADLVVQSTHKTLSALTQASMLHVQGSRIDRDRLSRSLQLVQSTSPSYLLLASLDAARQQMATQGQALMSQALQLADFARTQISQIPGLSVLPDQAGSTPGWWESDRTRLTIDVRGLGLTGFQVDEILHQTLGVTVELPTLHSLTLIMTPGNTQADVDRLIAACQSLPTSLPVTPSPVTLHPSTLPTLPRLSPRQAFFAPTTTLPTASAIGQVSAEWICPYPPGIPVVFPGEVITVEAVQSVHRVLAAGGVVTGCTDPTLRTLKTVSLPQ